MRRCLNCTPAQISENQSSDTMRRPAFLFHTVPAVHGGSKSEDGIYELYASLIPVFMFTLSVPY